MPKISRRSVIKLTGALLGIGALGTAWGLTLLGGQANPHDPVAVAKQFVEALQANHPHTAYALTSSAYHNTIKETDFTKGVAADAAQALPQTKPQLFSQAVPSKDSGVHGQMRILMNIPHDGQTEDYEILLIMAQDAPQTSNSPWRVQSVTFGAGTAKH